MSAIPAKLRPVVVLLTFASLTLDISADQLPQTSYGVPRGQELISFLTRSIEWYRSASAERQFPSQPADVPFLENTRALSIQILRLSFDYAKALVAAEGGNSFSPDPQPTVASADSSASDLERLVRMGAQCETQAQNARNDVASVQNRIDSQHRKKEDTKLKAALEESESRLDLIQAQCQSYQNLLDFLRTTNASQRPNQGLTSIVDDLSRTVPELANTDAATPPQSVSSAVVPDLTGSTIPTLISGVLGFRRKLEALNQASRSTDRLAQSSESLRAPLAQYLNSALEGTNFNNRDLQRSDLEALRQQKTQLDNLLAKITALSPAVVALDKQKVLLDMYKSDLARWHTLILSQYTAAWEKLIVHLVALGSVMILLAAFAAALRRFTFRYIHDANRRGTILIAERILLWLCIVLVATFALVSNLGSLATFLGLLTAGLAVALQNVILAVLGYAVLVGKLGLRLGDRVQISGVTGEVVEFGFLQFQVRELDVEARPTGRIGSFSNSFVFVSPAIGIFKLGALKTPATDSNALLTLNRDGK